MKVVRCPNCRGACRVAPEAIGLLVVCPRCNGPFLAVEEAPVAPPPAPRPRRRPEPAPAGGRPARPRRSAEPVTPPGGHPGHDAPPHADPGRLPVSVLIGLALLPFAIPILWLIAPAVVGQEPMLSWAVPVALAVSASILCLAVIYTIDWSPGTRVKGVLMIVALAYFAALNLYFLKKQMVDEVRKFFGAGKDWVEVSADGYRVKMPTKPTQTDEQPMGQFVRLTCCRSSQKPPFIGEYYFVAGSSKSLGEEVPKGPAETDKWYNRAVDQIVAQSGGTHRGRIQYPTQQDSFIGRELEIEFADGRVRVVRIFLIKDRVYYLSVEGPGPPDEDLIEPFFESFLVPDAR